MSVEPESIGLRLKEGVLDELVLNTVVAYEDQGRVYTVVDFDVVLLPNGRLLRDERNRIVFQEFRPTNHYLSLDQSVGRIFAETMEGYLDQGEKPDFNVTLANTGGWTLTVKVVD